MKTVISSLALAAIVVQAAATVVPASLKLEGLNKQQTFNIVGEEEGTSSTFTFFEPDDPDWPGEFAPQGLTLNVKLDDYPEEFRVTVESALKSSGTTIVAEKTGLLSTPLVLPDSDTLYRIELLDSGGDGICCDYGSGWATITDQDSRVLWSITGNYSYVATAYLLSDAFGNFELVGDTSHSSVGEPTATDSSSTITETSKQAAVVFNPETDDPYWPGEFPTGEYFLTVNMKMDDFPNEFVVNVWPVFGRTTPAAKRSIKTDKQVAGSIMSVGLELGLTQSAMETLYRFEFVDLAGDGICCDHGTGWITVTDRNGHVLWSIAGDYGHVASAYLINDSFKNFTLVGDTQGQTTTMGSVESDATVKPPSPATEVTWTFEDEPVPPPAPETCQLCPGLDSVGLPLKNFAASTGENITCAQVETAWESLTFGECEERALTGFTQYYRVKCECPGYEPTCNICSPGQEVDVSLEIPFDDGATQNCGVYDFAVGLFDLENCERFKYQGSQELLADICGCA